MRVVVTGATGNVGSSVVRALAASERVSEIVGVARRLPRYPALEGVSYRAADLTRDPLRPLLEGADAVVHLAWAIQPARDRRKTRTINVEGSRRLFEAAAAEVPALVYASSIGAYSPAEGRRDPVDESWPTEGVPSSFYSVDKAEVEALLDETSERHPGLRVVRLRPALIFKRDAGSEIRRLFAGPLVPNRLLDPDRLPLLPWIRGLRAQALHSDDVADAYRRAVESSAAEGAFNIAAEPVLDADSLSAALGVRVVELPAGLVRAAADASYRLRLQPTPPGWVDMALAVPLIDASRAREELGWQPTHEAGATLRELLGGLAESAGERTPPLAPDEGGPRARLAELLRGGPPR